MVGDPGHHAAESATGFAIRVDVLFFGIQIRIIHARSTRNQNVDIAWDWGERAVRGMTMIQVFRERRLIIKRDELTLLHLQARRRHETAKEDGNYVQYMPA